MSEKEARTWKAAEYNRACTWLNEKNIDDAMTLRDRIQLVARECAEIASRADTNHDAKDSIYRRFDLQDVRGVQCGIDGCEWVTIYPELEQRPLSSSEVTSAYSTFYHHCIKSHGLDPTTSRAPLASASYRLILTFGTMTVQMTPKEP
jgi:hypothetical protein